MLRCDELSSNGPVRMITRRVTVFATGLLGRLFRGAGDRGINLAIQGPIVGKFLSIGDRLSNGPSSQVRA